MLSACVSSVPRSTPVAEIGTRRAARHDELLDGLRRRIELIDLAAQRLELGERELARAAFGAGRAAATAPFASSRAGVNGSMHVLASGVSRISVVVARSFCACRQTSSRSFVKVTSHSSVPAPMR